MRLIMFFVIISVFTVSCKKTGIKDYNVTANYIRVPQIALDTTITTYQVDFDRYASDGAFNAGFNQMNYLNNINLPGYKKVNFGADLNIILGLGNGYFYDRGIQTNKIKDKNGVETITYYRQLEYSNFAFYRLFDKNRRMIDEQEVQNRNQSDVYKSSTFTSAKDCEAWWSKNGNNIVEELRTNMINNSQRLINTSLNTKYSWSETSSRVEFNTLKDKENRNFKKWQSNDEIVKMAFRTMSSYSTTEYEKRIMPAIEFWENEFNSIRNSDEKSLYLKWACLQNIALAYFWMDEFDKARDYTFKMNEIPINTGQTKRFLNMIEDTILRLEKVGVTKQHINLRRSNRFA